MINVRVGDWVGYHQGEYATAIVLAIFDWGVQIVQDGAIVSLHWEDVCPPF